MRGNIIYAGIGIVIGLLLISVTVTEPVQGNIVTTNIKKKAKAIETFTSSKEKIKQAIDAITKTKKFQQLIRKFDINLSKAYSGLEKILTSINKASKEVLNTIKAANMTEQLKTNLTTAQIGAWIAIAIGVAIAAGWGAAVGTLILPGVGTILGAVISGGIAASPPIVIVAACTARALMPGAGQFAVMALLIGFWPLLLLINL